MRHILILAGGKGWHFEPIFQLVKDLGLEDRVQFPGYVSADEKGLWYTAADLFAYPSIYEGFGLQLLEAMAHGTPVVASDSSSLPEVVGDAGILVKPSGVQELADAMYRVLTDRETRSRMREAGLERAKRFSWQRMTNETVQLYEEVLDF